jgi:hypothetical protein
MPGLGTCHSLKKATMVSAKIRVESKIVPAFLGAYVVACHSNRKGESKFTQARFHVLHPEKKYCPFISENDLGDGELTSSEGKVARVKTVLDRIEPSTKPFERGKEAKEPLCFGDRG